jgi:hypothetical protein
MPAATRPSSCDRTLDDDSDERDDGAGPGDAARAALELRVGDAGADAVTGEKKAAMEVDHRRGRDTDAVGDGTDGSGTDDGGTGVRDAASRATATGLARDTVNALLKRLRWRVTSLKPASAVAASSDAARNPTALVRVLRLLGRPSSSAVGVEHPDAIDPHAAGVVGGVLARGNASPSTPTVAVIVETSSLLPLTATSAPMPPHDSPHAPPTRRPPPSTSSPSPPPSGSTELTFHSHGVTRSSRAALPRLASSNRSAARAVVAGDAHTECRRPLSSASRQHRLKYCSSST